MAKYRFDIDEVIDQLGAALKKCGFKNFGTIQGISEENDLEERI